MTVFVHIEVVFNSCSPHQRGTEGRPVDFHSFGGPGKLSRAFPVLTSSAYARDFRLFDMEREENDCSTARGAIGNCIGKEEEDPPERNDEEPMLVHFTLTELELVTGNFSKENLIGHGGFSEVFKGHFKSGQFVAVKRLTKGTANEKIASFLSELGVIAHLNHPNIAKLVGCCVEGGLHLVLQLSPLGSLGDILHGSKCHLDWGPRYKIALGTANGLQYLHESCQRRIIHRDIKADNILLAEDFEPQVSCC
ncbi:hypothetical protein MLD38_025482 [Melastoma candidum]|uniref:Uncharacterized protein n=1 Tax=Melastoma candidum TaxID=119954 RepID=A0ACB9NWG9_9MYRT|nr:hypothetical protein MLD38_025482 [Melastoma candidum]